MVKYIRKQGLALQKTKAKCEGEPIFYFLVRFYCSISGRVSIVTVGLKASLCGAMDSQFFYAFQGFMQALSLGMAGMPQNNDFIFEKLILALYYNLIF